MKPGSLDPRILERLQPSTEPSPARTWVLQTYGAAAAEPSRATGILRAAARDSRKLRSRERRELWDVVYALIRNRDAYAALGRTEVLDAWLDDPDLSGLPFEARAGCSAEVASDLFATYGEAREAWLDASNARAPVHLRVHVGRTDVASLQGRLAKDGIDTTPLGTTGLRVEGRANLVGNRAFLDGLFELQDHASQQIAGLVKGRRVLDFCAGAGGKSLALAALGKRVTAWDVRGRALDELRKRATRARSHVEVLSSPPTGTYETVLVDAPCSGSGVWRRHPEYRWRLPELPEFGVLQRQILEQASRCVASGGTLIYATCSSLRAEDEAVASSLGWTVTETLRTAPHLDDADGMYAAVLQR